MKKLISLFLVTMLCFGCIGAHAANTPSFMEKMYNNYTADYSFSMKIHDADKIAKFLKELNMEHLDKFLDVDALIESLFDVSSVVNVQADISEDFRRISAGITMETDGRLVLNRNYETTHLAKMGMWVKIDLDKRELLVVYSTPLNEKYAVIDLLKDAPAEVSNEVFDMCSKMLNRDNIEKHNKEIVRIATEHADISVKGKTTVLHYDNDAFTNLIDDSIKYMLKFYEDMGAGLDEEAMANLEFPSFKGMKLLGEEGITCTFRLSGNNIKDYSEKWDVSIDIADIFNTVTGMSWDYEFDGNINITLESSGNVSKIGTTVVTMPSLNADNSFNLIDFFENLYTAYDYIEEGEAEPYIPSYVWGETEIDTFDGERYYLPVRSCIEEAYAGCSDIIYDNGLVTINTNSGIEGKDINATFREGEDTAVVNGSFYNELGIFKTIDGKIYASVDFFEKCLGWELEYLQKDLLNGYLYYEFCTIEYEEDFE